ncbi:unnamed protein product [Pseudo-nitzschia multistriata]|uniref:Uncharacterized protein n=1 Tax=Pseudo-nitzschia multistriata TaxID=183589 RepID=A0A448Z812_9STRA|nr:unnamed protein product [Pseudo-nitzschia multistriata]
MLSLSSHQIPMCSPASLLQDPTVAMTELSTNKTRLPTRRPKSTTKKSVRFNQMVHVAPFERASPEEANHIWFTNPEIASFKEAGRKLAVVYRKWGGNLANEHQHEHEQEHEQEQRRESNDDNDLSIYRGFESCTFVRQRQRLLSNRCVVYAHKNGMGGDFVAAIYQQCNRWSTEVAFVQALHDYVEVFYSNNPKSSSSSSNSSSSSSINTTTNSSSGNRTKDHDRNRLNESAARTAALAAMMIPSVSSMVPPPDVAFAVEGAHALRKQKRKHRRQTHQRYLSSQDPASSRRVRARAC